MHESAFGVKVTDRENKPVSKRTLINEPSQAWIFESDSGQDKARPSDVTTIHRDDESQQKSAASKIPCDFIGRSAAMRRVFHQIEIVAPTEASVLILGETGTGKELVARAVHNLSRRNNRTLAAVNCAAIPSGLLESELFGHEKGSFTGAIARRTGRFEQADRGSLFLDEIGDFPSELQPKLLRVLQEKEFERVGSNQVQSANVRLIAATSRNLQQMVHNHQFRSDLFYRLNVFPIRIPPLRERSSDIPLLVWHFVEQYARRLGKVITCISEEVMDKLKNYSWPGNIRELQNFIERAVILSPGKKLEVPMEEVEQGIQSSRGEERTIELRIATLREHEHKHIIRALTQTRWLVGGPNGAAALLGIRRTTLQSRMQKLGISRQSKQEQ